MAETLREDDLTPLQEFRAYVAGLRAGGAPEVVCKSLLHFAGRIEDARSESPSPEELPLDASCPNCGNRFRFSATDTYRNHRCPAESPAPEGLHWHDVPGVGTLWWDASGKIVGGPEDD